MLRGNHILEHLWEEIIGRIFRREMNNTVESRIVTVMNGITKESIAKDIKNFDKYKLHLRRRQWDMKESYYLSPWIRCTSACQCGRFTSVGHFSGVGWPSARNKKILECSKRICNMWDDKRTTLPRTLNILSSWSSCIINRILCIKPQSGIA